MPRGKAPDPTRARRGTGNRPKPGEARPSREIVPAIILDPAHALPEPPDTLEDGAKQIWLRVVAELDTRGLKETDLEAVTMLAHAAWAHAETRRWINAQGVVVKDPRNGRPMVNPLLKVARDEASTYLRLANEFGLTPAARLRLGLMTLAGQSLAQALADDLDRG